MRALLEGIRGCVALLSVFFVGVLPTVIAVTVFLCFFHELDWLYPLVSIGVWFLSQFVAFKVTKEGWGMGVVLEGVSDWFVLGRECVDCIKENFLGLSYLCDYDYQTGEIGSMLKFDSYDKACAYIEEVLGETPDEDVVAVLLSEAKDHACKHAKELIDE